MSKALIFLAIFNQVNCQYGMRNQLNKDYAFRRPFSMSPVLPYRRDYFIRRPPFLRLEKEDLLGDGCDCDYHENGNRYGCKIDEVHVAMFY